MDSSSSESSVVKTRWIWRRRSYWNRYQYLFMCFVVAFVIGVPVLLLAIVVPNSPKSVNLPKPDSPVNKPTIVRGWAPDITRDVRHYILPNSTTTLMQPQWHCGNHTPYLIIIVNSALQHDQKRMAIRDTWGGVHKESNETVHLAFLIGTPAANPSADFIQRKLLDESMRYGDMIQEPFVDTYNNLTLKPLSANVHPNFLSGGSSYVMSADAVAPLFTAALDIPLFHFEDVFVTGICARAARIIPRDHPAFSDKSCSIDPRVLRDTSVVSCYIKDGESLRKAWADIQAASLFNYGNL